MLENSLKKARALGDLPLLTYGPKTLTFSKFAEIVENWSKQLKEQLTPGTIVVLKNQNPIDFYPLLFAAQQADLVTILPNKDFLSGKTLFNFAKYSLKVANLNVEAEENKNFHAVEIPKATQAVLFSSGSTGSPKGACHEFNHFLKNAESVNKKVQYQKSITPLKPYLVSALAHFICHYIAGKHIIFFDDQITTNDFQQLTKDYPEAGFVSSPIHILKYISYFDPKANPAYFFSSGDFIYAQTVNKIFELYPETIFYKVYGLAEIGGRFFVNILKKGATESEINSAGVPIEQTELILRDNQIFVDSEFLFFGYLKETGFEKAQQPHPTGDLCEVKGALVTLTGRASEEIKVGGQKVLLSQISKKLEELIAPNTFAVVPQAHPVFGNLISLVVTNSEFKRSELQTLIKNRLDKSEIPHNYFFTENLPRTASGKVDKKQTKDNIGTYRPLL